jgi:serine/threonine protein phosphatase PrpC
MRGHGEGIVLRAGRAHVWHESTDATDTRWEDVAMTPRSRYRFGALAFAAVTLAGCLAALPAPAAAARAAVPFASGRPPEAVAYARPAVVRVLVKYYGTMNSGAVVPVPVFCVGTGALVGTAGANAFNYVLTATSLVNPTTPCEGARAAFQQINGRAREWGLDHIEVWLAAAYTGARPNQLGTIKYRIDPSQITAASGPFAPKLIALPLATLSGAPNHDLPVLEPPQPSDPPAGPNLTVMDLGGVTLQPLGSDSLVDTQISGSLYPVELDAGQLNPEVVATATQPPSKTPGTATPAQSPTAAPTQTTTPAAQQLSPGAPVVDDTGRLAGMVILDDTGARVVAPLAQVSAAIGAVSGKPGSLMTQWSKGLAAFYSTPPNFADAASAFTALRGADPDFGEVQAFLDAARHHSTDVAALGNPPTATPTTSTGPTGSSGFISLPVLLVVIGLVLFALLLLVALLIHRAFEGRRALPWPRPQPSGSGMPARAPIRIPTARVSTPMGAGTSNMPSTFGGPSSVSEPSGFGGPSGFGSPARASGPASFGVATGASEPARFDEPVGVDDIATQPQQAIPAMPTPSSFTPGAPPPDFALEPPPPFASEATAPSGGTDTEDLPTWVMPAAPAAPLSRGPSLVPQVAALTDPGRKRAADPNQDNILALVGASMVNGRPLAYGLFVIADGMGGHTNGKEASRHTVEVIARHVIPALTSGQPLDAAMLPELLRQGAMQANAELRQQNEARNADMGTTLTAALVLSEVAYVANIGDSRTYVFSPESGLRQITTDHSVVASLVSAGVIRPEDVYTHPRRNQIYRSLGGQHEDAEVDTFQVALQAGDKLLLCSDGLWEMVRDPQIEAILRTAADPQEAAATLVREANDNGGEDNISVVVVRMLDEQVPEQLVAAMQVIAAPEETQLPTPGQG